MSASSAPAIVSMSSLPSLIDRAASALMAARSSAEILDAKEMASFAYDAAKKAARLSKAKDAHDTVVAAAYRMQADALEIESQAKRRIADEYDAAQERGEIASPGKPVNIPDGNNKPTVRELGFTAKSIHEARQVRDAEVDSPGIIRRSLDALVGRGQEPSRAALRQAVVDAAERGLRPERRPTRVNPIHQPSASFDAVAGVAGSCRRILEFVEKHGADRILNGCVDEGMRARTIVTLSSCRDALNDILEQADAEIADA